MAADGLTDWEFEPRPPMGIWRKADLEGKRDATGVQDAKHQRNLAILKDRRDGMTYKQIAEKHMVSMSTVATVIGKGSR